MREALGKALGIAAFFLFSQSLAAAIMVSFASPEQRDAGLGLIGFQSILLSYVALLGFVFHVRRRAHPGASLLGGWFDRPPELARDLYMPFNFMIGLFIFYVVYGLLYQQLAGEPPDASNPVAEMLADDANLRTILIVTVLIGAPWVEELVFRGLMLDRLKGGMGFYTANLVQAFLFAAVHLQPSQFPQLFFIGLLLGLLRERSGALWAPIVLHTMNNSMALLFL